MPDTTESTPVDFIRNIIAEDIKTQKHQGKVITRFPPEPNGYLHIGHAKAICLNFTVAKENKGVCFLRYDDTNPEKEDMEFVEAIQADVKWLGFDWGDRLTHASDYFDKLHAYAVQLIKDGKAYVCDLNADEMRQYRGTLTEPGKDSPYRNRSVEENLDLFERMRNGEFEEGEHTLRSKIDMSSGNINMRDPIIYRIRKVSHQRTGNKWCIYPMYDFTHCLSDAIEEITHSLCTLEFQDHRPLYDWYLDELKTPCHPQQIEFARLNLNYTITSKRKLKELVEEKHVSGWDDPRMPTLVGVRRRGFTPAAIRNFCERIGVAKKETVIDMSILEDCVRNDLNDHAPRAMCVLRTLRLVIDNYPEDKVEEIEAPNHPNDPSLGTRKIPFSKVMYIEKDDFLEEPPKKFFRLSPGKEVRLRYAYCVKCVDVIKDDKGEVVEVHCTCDPETLGANPKDGRKVKGILHWVSASHGKKAEVRIYDRLFNKENPASGDEDFKTHLNPDSLEVIKEAYVEPSLVNASPEDRFQFERLGYFGADRYDYSSEQLVFNRIVSLRDAWAKIKGKK